MCNEQFMTSSWVTFSAAKYVTGGWGRNEVWGVSLGSDKLGGGGEGNCLVKGRH